MNTLTIEFLKNHNANQNVIDFCINNKLIGFPLNKIKKIQGDYNTYFVWIKTLCNEIVKYDPNNNLIHYKSSNGFEYWKRFDQNNNLIHYKDEHESEYWQDYDQNNNLIHCKYNNGFEYWKEYDQNNNLIHYKDSTGNEEHYVVEYYEDGQLKRYEDLKIPWYKKD